MTNAQAPGSYAPAEGAALTIESTGTPFSIAGSASDTTDSRPRRVVGIEDDSNPSSSIANRLRLVGTLPVADGWSTVQGGWAASDDGSATGLSLSGTADVHVEHVRIHGGSAPGGTQRGVVLADLVATANTPTIDGCLIEACGHLDGLQPSAECANALAGPSVGAQVATGSLHPRWPLLFTNNLVFGGFASNGAGQASIALLCAVDDPSHGNDVTTRRFIHNFFSGQGLEPVGGCGSTTASRSEAIRIVLEQAQGASIARTTVADFLNNIIHDGGLACERFGVVEDTDVDVLGLGFGHNDFLPPLAGHDVTGPGVRAVLFREARSEGSIDHCELGGAVPFPACLATTLASSYVGVVSVDPGLQAADLFSLLLTPGAAPLDGFRTSNVALCTGAPTAVSRDLFGGARSQASPTLGPAEQSCGGD